MIPIAALASSEDGIAAVEAVFESGMFADGPEVRAFAEGSSESEIVLRNSYHDKLPEPTTEPTNIYRSCRNSGTGQSPAVDPSAGISSHYIGQHGPPQPDGNLLSEARAFGGGDARHGRTTEVRA